MTKKHIIIAGGTGFMGQCLMNYYQNKYQIFVLTRGKTELKSGVQYLNWDAKTLGEWQKSLENAEMLINLTGRTVNCRYNEKNRRDILESRTFSTEILGKAIQNCQNPPKIWINAASATIYRHTEDRQMDEDTGEIGSGFSVEVCKAWEKVFDDAKTPQTRKIALRVAMVLGKNGGVMTPFMNLVKWGLGGTEGDGNQYISWIHAIDFCRIIDFMEANPQLQGVYNAAAPKPERNRDFLKILRQTMKMPFGLPATKWMLTIGAWLIGTETELILKSRNVIPTRLLNAGFKFQYETVNQAFEEIVNG